MDGDARWTAAEVFEDLRSRLPRRARLVSPAILRTVGAYEALGVLQRTEGTQGASFVRSALNVLDVSYRVESHRYPPTVPDGPLLVVANHHLGGLDALALLDFLLSHRPDALVIANQFLWLLPPMRPLMIPAHALSTGISNAEAKDRARAHLERGGCLLVFPAARVAGLTPRFQLRDSEWRYGTGDLIRATRPVVLPIAVRGSNSAPFYVLRALSVRLSTAALLRQLLRARGTSTSLVVGAPIQSSSLVERSSAEIVTALRSTTYALFAQNHPVRQSDHGDK